MKLDCAISYYQRPELWPWVCGGLRNNEEYLEALIVVNDEKWTPKTAIPVYEERPEDSHLLLLDHKHEDNFGLARSNNEGIAAADTEHVLCLDDDIVLAAYSLERMMPSIRPGRLLYGRVENNYPILQKVDDRGHILSQKVDFGVDYDFEIQTTYGLLSTGEAKNALDLLLAHCCGGFFITHKASHDRMGGYNEDLTERGYLDTDYALRWLLTFGPDSVGLGLGGTWHLDAKIRKRGPKNIEHINQLYNQVLSTYPNLAMKAKTK